uniref:Uncharacterized protein n=1 Tax=Pithovirus LCPAC404 TaxID=2506597 RepID=A0A481ZC14_9VIRU|nr:MAG: hypothetical protein LCPAC404_01770 [Pithovirus LCPAC404]
MSIKNKSDASTLKKLKETLQDPVTQRDKINFSDVICEPGEKHCIRGYHENFGLFQHSSHDYLNVAIPSDRTFHKLFADNNMIDCSYDRYPQLDHNIIVLQIYINDKDVQDNSLDADWIAVDFKKDAFLYNTGLCGPGSYQNYFNSRIRLKDYLKMDKIPGQWYDPARKQIAIYDVNIPPSKFASHGTGMESMREDYRIWETHYQQSKTLEISWPSLIDYIGVKNEPVTIDNAEIKTTEIYISAAQNFSNMINHTSKEHELVSSYGADSKSFSEDCCSRNESNCSGISQAEDIAYFRKSTPWYRNIPGKILDFFISPGHTSGMVDYRTHEERSDYIASSIGIGGRALTRTMQLNNSLILSTFLSMKSNTLNSIGKVPISLSFANYGVLLANSDDGLELIPQLSSQITGTNIGSQIGSSVLKHPIVGGFAGGVIGGIAGHAIMHTLVNVDPKVSATYGTASAIIFAKPALNYIRFGQFKSVGILPPHNPLSSGKIIKPSEIFKKKLNLVSDDLLIYDINDKGKLTIAKVNHKKVPSFDFTLTGRPSVATGHLHVLDGKMFYEMESGSFNVNHYVVQRYGINPDGTYTNRALQFAGKLCKAAGIIGFHLSGVGPTSEEFPNLSPGALGITATAAVYPPLLIAGITATALKPLGDAMQKGADITKKQLEEYPSPQIPMPINGLTGEQYLVAGGLMGKGLSVVSDAVLTTLRWTKEKIDKGLVISGNMIVPSAHTAQNISILSKEEFADLDKWLERDAEKNAKIFSKTLAELAGESDEERYRRRIYEDILTLNKQLTNDERLDRYRTLSEETKITQKSDFDYYVANLSAKERAADPCLDDQIYQQTSVAGRSISKMIVYNLTSFSKLTDMSTNKIKFLEKSSLSTSIASAATLIAKSENKLEMLLPAAGQIVGCNLGAKIGSLVLQNIGNMVPVCGSMTLGTIGGMFGHDTMTILIESDPRFSIPIAAATAALISKPALNVYRFGHLGSPSIIPNKYSVKNFSLIKPSKISKQIGKESFIFHVDNKGKLNVARGTRLFRGRKARLDPWAFNPTGKPTVDRGYITIQDDPSSKNGRKMDIISSDKHRIDSTKRVFQRHGINPDGTYTNRALQFAGKLCKAVGIIDFHLAGVGTTSKEFPKFSPAALGITAAAGAYTPLLAIGTAATVLKPIANIVQREANIMEKNLKKYPSIRTLMPTDILTIEQKLSAGKMIWKGIGVASDAVLTSLRWTKENMDKGLVIAGNMIVPSAHSAESMIRFEQNVEVISDNIEKMSWNIYQGEKESIKMSRRDMNTEISQDSINTSDAEVIADNIEKMSWSVYQGARIKPIKMSKIDRDRPKNSKIELGSASQWLQTAGHVMKATGDKHMASKLITGGAATDLITEGTKGVINMIKSSKFSYTAVMNFASAISLFASLFQDDETNTSRVATSIQRSTESLSQQISEVYSLLRDQGIQILNQIDTVKLQSLNKFLEASKQRVEFSEHLLKMHEDIVIRLNNRDNLIINMYGPLIERMNRTEKLFYSVIDSQISSTLKEGVLASQEDISLSTYQRLFRKVATIGISESPRRTEVITLQHLYEKITESKIETVSDPDLLFGCTLVLAALMNNQITQKHKRYPSQRTLDSQWNHIKNMLRLTCCIINLMVGFKDMIMREVEIQHIYLKPLYKLMFNDIEFSGDPKTERIDNPAIKNIILTIAYLERNVKISSVKFSSKSSVVDEALNRWNSLTEKKYIS